MDHYFLFFPWTWLYIHYQYEKGKKEKYVMLTFEMGEKTKTNTTYKLNFDPLTLIVYDGGLEQYHYPQDLSRPALQPPSSSQKGDTEGNPSSGQAPQTPGGASGPPVKITALYVPFLFNC